MKKRTKFVLTGLLTLLVMLGLVLTVSASAAPWVHTFIEEQGGGYSFEEDPDDDGDEIRYDCEPSTATWGCKNDGGQQCVQNYTRNLRTKGVGCGPKFFYMYQGEEEVMNFHTTTDAEGFPEIPGWRECYTGDDPEDIVLQQGYFATMKYNQIDGPWKIKISWDPLCIAPHKVNFRYDPNTPTYCEYFDC